MGCGASSEEPAATAGATPRKEDAPEQDPAPAVHHHEEVEAAPVAAPLAVPKRFGDASAVFIEIEDLRAALEADPQSVRMIDVRQAPPADRPMRPSVGVGGCPHASLPRDLTGAVGPLTGMHPIPDAEAFIETVRRRFGIGRCAPEKEATIVVFDGMGGAVAAGRLWWHLDTLGVPNVYILNGGFQAYKASGLPLTDAPPPELFDDTAAPTAADSVSNKAADVPASKDAAAIGVVPWPYRTSWWRIKEVSEVPQVPALCDCRPAAGCFSTVRPCLAGVKFAGRIPNASPFPGNRNLVEMNRLRPWSELREKFETKLKCAGIASFDEATYSCSAGVWCCFNAAIATHLGLGTPAVFFGSWTCYESHFPDEVVARTKGIHGVATVKVHKHNPKAWQIVGEEVPPDSEPAFDYIVSSADPDPAAGVEATEEGQDAVRKLLRVMVEDEKIEAETASGVRFTVETTAKSVPAPDAQASG